MLAHERQAIIIEHLKEHRVVKIADMVAEFGISSLMARRDLDALRDRGILRRVYGGAILTADPATLTDGAAFLPTRDAQERKSLEGRKALAKLAASLVQEGEVLFMGNGRTVQAIAHNLRSFSNLTIVTSSLSVINELATTTNNIYILGGHLNNSEHSIESIDNYQMLERFCADKTFISCDGATLSHGVSSGNPVGVEIGRIMVKNSHHAVLVVDSRTFGTNSLRVVCSLEDVDTIVTDGDLSREHQEGITKLGIDLLISEGEDKDEEE